MDSKVLGGEDLTQSGQKRIGRERGKEHLRQSNACAVHKRLVSVSTMQHAENTEAWNELRH